MKRQSRQVNRLTGQLREQSRKVTGPRRAILELLSQQKHPVSIRRIHELMSDSSCDLATVYRSMKMLDRLGMVRRFDFGDAVARYELNRHADGGHHHHLICTDCAKVVEIQECFPSELEEKIAAGNGFASITHRLEFFGICPKCQGRQSE
jgi:Fur family transcriptional regulator, ferric uptake regulator